MPYAIDALAGKRILVAEDDYLIADTIVAAIESAGGAVTGPFASIERALESLGTAPPPDAAALNIRLLDGESYPLADALVERNIPFVFASANSAATMPARFGRVPLVAKPYAAREVVQALSVLVDR